MDSGLDLTTERKNRERNNMGFMKKDIGYGYIALFFLVLVIIGVGAAYSHYVLSELSSREEAASAKANALEEKYESTTATLEEKSETLKLKEQSVDDLSNQFSEVRTAKENVEKENTRLSDELQKANREKAILQANLNKATDEVEDLKHDVKTLNNAIDDLEEALDQCKNPS